MAATSVVGAAMRLSALAIAAGTVLGIAAAASAQSRPVEVRPEIRIERGGEGGDQKEERRIEVRVQRGDDDDAQPRRERRVIVRRGGESHGNVCPECGRPLDDDDRPARGERRRITLFGEGEEGGAMRWRTLPEGGPHAERFPLPEGVEGHALQWRVEGAPEGVPGNKIPRRFRVEGLPGGHGEAIILGPGGERREFRSGGEGREGGEEGDHVIRLRRGGDGPGRIELRRGPGGDVKIEGKIIIIGPDGERQEFDLGGPDGLNMQRDGDPEAAHPGEGEGRRVVPVWRLARGSTL